MANRRPMLTFAEKKEYYDRGIHFGADGTPVHDGTMVYVVGELKIVEVDYFHGCNMAYANEPMFQTCPDKDDYTAGQVISMGGFVVKAMTKIQRMFRSKQNAA